MFWMTLAIWLLFPSVSFASLLTLTWQDTSNNEDGFRCERSTSGGSFSQVVDVGMNIQTWQDLSVTGGTNYCYRCLAYNTVGVSGYTNTACATATATTAGVAQIACVYMPTPPPSSGPVLAMNFNEASGTVLLDRSGSGNNGSLNNATRTSSGKYGKALAFNGTSQYATIPDSNSLDLTNGMTLEAWVYPTSLGGWRDVIYKGQDDAYYLSGSSPQSNRPATGGTYAGNLYATAALPLNTWSHLATTYNGATLRLYVNGVQVASRAQTGTIQVTTGIVSLGGDPTYGQFWAGRIDDIRVYNRTLTVIEIQTDMNTPIG